MAPQTPRNKPYLTFGTFFLPPNLVLACAGSSFVVFSIELKYFRVSDIPCSVRTLNRVVHRILRVGDRGVGLFFAHLPRKRPTFAIAS